MNNNTATYRLVTRPNLDGIANAILLSKLGMIDDVIFAGEDEIRHEEVTISQKDIVTNLPFIKNAYMAFDHTFDSKREHILNPNHVLFSDVHSTSQVIYEYYEMQDACDEDLLPLVYAANGDIHGDFDQEELLCSKTWDALSALIDLQTLDFVKSLTFKHYEYA